MKDNLSKFHGIFNAAFLKGEFDSIQHIIFTKCSLIIITNVFYLIYFFYLSRL